MLSTATNAVAVVPSDTVPFPRTTGLYVGGAGNVTVTMGGSGGSKATFMAVPAGTLLNIEVIQVWATGTTATNMLVLR